MIRKTNILLAVAGLALLTFAAGRIGWADIARAMVQARAAIVVLIGLSLLRLILQTWSWSIALKTDGIEPSTIELMLIRLASQGMGYLTVLGAIASEPMKISLLKKRGGSATAATLVDSGVYWFTSGLVGIAGCFSAALYLAHGGHSAVSSAIVAAMIAAGLIAIARAESRLSALAGWLGSRCPGWLEKAARIEVAIREFRNRHRSAIRRMFVLDLACQVLLAAEVVAILWCLSLPPHAGAVLAIEGATRAIKIVSGWMPARIGADESGIAAVFLGLGLSPVSGLILALARRTRDLLAAFVGLAWLAWNAKAWKVTPPRLVPKLT